MSISLLRTLIAVSETGSFAGAADRVCVSQAAVGQQMRRLEQEFQVTLFDRSGKRPALTHLGHALVPKAQEVVRAYETLLHDLTGEAQYIGELTLGAVPSTIRGLIPRSLMRLRQNYPDLHIRVIPDLTAELFARVESGVLDAAVISRPAYLESHMKWQPFVQEELVLLTSPEIQSDDPERIIVKHPYIRHTRRAAVGVIAEDWLRRNKVVVRDVMEMGSLENIASMVSYNLGVSLVPNLCVQDPIFAALQKISLGDSAIFRELGVITRQDCSKMMLVDRLLHHLDLTVSDEGHVVRDA